MAAYSEITLEQYASFSTTVNVEDAQGEALNLTNYSGYAQLRKSPYSSVANNFVVSVSDASNGELTLAMSSSNTATLTPGRYLYDLIIVGPSPSTDTTRVVEGIVTVLPGITRV